MTALPVLPPVMIAWVGRFGVDGKTGSGGRRLPVLTGSVAYLIRGGNELVGYGYGKQSSELLSEVASS